MNVTPPVTRGGPGLRQPRCRRRRDRPSTEDSVPALPHRDRKSTGQPGRPAADCSRPPPGSAQPVTAAQHGGGLVTPAARLSSACNSLQQTLALLFAETANAAVVVDAGLLHHCG